MAGLGLSELARYGFVDLEATVGKLDQLVSLVGDAGRSALAELGFAANPDQALNALLELAEANRSEVKKLLGKTDTAARLVRTVGASSAMVDLLRRHPQLLSVFEAKQQELPTLQELHKRFQDSVKIASSKVEDRWVALRISYRTELLRLIGFDVTASNPQEAFQKVSAQLADLATEAIEAGLTIARWELANTTDHGSYSSAEVEATRFGHYRHGQVRGSGTELHQRR